MLGSACVYCELTQLIDLCGITAWGLHLDGIFSMLCQMLGPACHVSLWIDSIDLNQIDLCSGQWYWSLKFVPGWSFNANAGCQNHHQAKDSGSLYFYTQGQKPWTGIVVSEETKQKCGLDWLILLPQVFWPMSTFVGFAILVICVNLFIMDQQAGLAFLPVMVLSTVTASASLQGPSAASEDDDQEKWLDDKLQQISSLDFYDFLAFSKFNRRWCCFCSWKIETTCIEIEIILWWSMNNLEVHFVNCPAGVSTGQKDCIMSSPHVKTFLILTKRMAAGPRKCGLHFCVKHILFCAAQHRAWRWWCWLLKGFFSIWSISMNWINWNLLSFVLAEPISVERCCVKDFTKELLWTFFFIPTMTCWVPRGWGLGLTW